MKNIFKIKLLLIFSLVFTLNCTDNGDDLTDKKEAISNVTAVAGIESVTLRWDLPSEKVKAYIISYNPGGVYLTQNDGTKNESVINGLTGGVEYTFTISWLDSGLKASKTISVSATPEIRQPGTFEGDLIFRNQADLDNFKLPNESALENVYGNLIIETDGSNNIFDLSVLKNLKLIRGNLRIIGNPILANLDNLSKLTKVEGREITIQNNRNLYSLCGISNVTGTNTITISGNDFNPTFAQIAAGNCKTTDVVYSGTLTRFNTQAEVDALPDGITHFPGELVIGLTAATNDIKDLSKFSKVRSVAGRVLIQFTPNITHLLGFRSLSTIGTNTAADELVIRSMQNLTTLDGLQALNYVARRVGIRQNPSLTTLEGINNLRKIGENNIAIGACGNAAQGNALLTDYCALKGLIRIIGIPALVLGGSCIDSYSTFNPSFQDILDGNCKK